MLGTVLKERIDIRSGEFTYGQWLLLIQLFEKNPEPADIMKEEMKILHGYELTDTDLLFIAAYIRNKESKSISEEFFKNTLAGYLEEINKGVKFWMEMMARISIPPTPEQERAKVGDLPRDATLYALAERFGQDPDTVWNWKFNKVYAILHSSAEEEKYKRRLQKAMKQ